MRRLLALLAILALTVLSAGAAIAAQAKDPAAEKSWPNPAELNERSYAAATGFGSAESVGNATLRLSGSDRFITAAAIADALWEYNNTIFVYLANGENFPDALGLGASTMDLGPLLLVTKDGLPEVTRKKLAELRPCFIVAAGGRGAISEEVLLEADRYADPAVCGDLF